MNSKNKIAQILRAFALFAFYFHVVHIGFAHAQGADQRLADDQIEISKPASGNVSKSKLSAITSTPNAESLSQPKVKNSLSKPVRVEAVSSSVGESSSSATRKSSASSKPVAPPANTQVAQILETPIPGVGSIPGVAHSNNVVRVGTERNEVVYIAANYPNRIATPFKSPKALGKQGDNEEIIKRVGSSLYVTPVDLEPIAIFVIGDSPSDPVFSLTLIPRDLPAQTIIAQLEPGNIDSSDAKNGTLPSTYVEKIQFLLKQVALGKAPEGYTEGALPKSVARGQYLSISPEIRYSGSSYDIYRYLVTATGDSPLELKEDIFYTPGVRAVAFFPKTILQRGEESYVFLIHQREGMN